MLCLKLQTLTCLGILHLKNKNNVRICVFTGCIQSCLELLFTGKLTLLSSDNGKYFIKAENTFAAFN